MKRNRKSKMENHNPPFPPSPYPTILERDEPYASACIRIANSK